MRIAYVCADRGVPVFGRKGSSIHVQEVIRALLRHNAGVELFACRLGGAAPAGLESVPVHEIPAVRDCVDPTDHENEIRRANAQLHTMLASGDPYSAVYERYSLWSFGGVEYACAADVPGVLEVNAPLVEEQALHRSLLHRASAERVAIRAFGGASTLIAVSSQVAAYLRDLAPLRENVHVVPNAVDPERFGEVESRPEGNTKEFTVGFVGSLRPWHGLRVLAEAFAILHERAPESRLLVVGDGPERESLAADLARLGVAEAAKLVGAVDPDSVPEFLSRMDVAVAPAPKTSSFYFSPLKVFEYMAAGIAVVAARVGQMTSLIDEERTGLLCPPGDAHALADALERLRREPDLRRRMGHEARATALREHTWDARVGAILHHAGLA